MSFDGIASVQSRIAAIQDKIASLSNQGRPPVAVTETAANSSNNSVKAENSDITPSTTPFASEYAKQISSAKVHKSELFAGRGEVQGTPGTAEAFVQRVKSYIGVPYVWGGTNPEKGLDCSGLVQTAAREVGVKLPRVTYDQQHAGEKVESIDDAKPGDLIICRNSGHVAVYIGDGRVVHAPRPGKTVTEASVEDMGPIDTIRRVMHSAGDTAVNVDKVEAAGVARRLASNAALTQLLGTNSLGGSGDLGSSLVSALSGKGGVMSSPAGYLGTLQGGIGTTSNNAALLSQLMGSGVATGTNRSTDINSMLGATSANASLSNTATSLSAMSALRSSLGV